MVKRISPDPKNMDEEYIKIEMVVHKKGITQVDVLEHIRKNVKMDYRDSHIDVSVLAVTGIEPVNEDAEFGKQMSAALSCAKAEKMQNWLDEGQGVIAEMFLKDHPMWPVVTNCPVCETPNINFPCKRCGYK